MLISAARCNIIPHLLICQRFTFSSLEIFRIGNNNMLVAASNDYRERGSLVVLVVAECSKNNEAASNATATLQGLFSKP